MSTNPARRTSHAERPRSSRADEAPHTAPAAHSELYERAAARPEGELLLLCARGVTGGVADESRARELASTAIDWDYLFRLAERHAVLPLLYRGLEAHAGGAAPRVFAERLRERCRENATRNMLLAGELARVVRLFESEGVPVLAYKGPALALRAYGELALRRFVDLDVLVRREDVRHAGELLLSLGYAKPEGLNPAHEKFLLRRQHNLAFACEAGRLVVELHWEVAPAPFAALPLGARTWERAEALEVFGQRVRTLSPEDLLLALCVHGAKHLWERLAWVCDVAALVNSHTDFDWAEVLVRARAARVERMLHLGLRLARALLGARVPENVSGEGSDPLADGLAAEVTEGLFRGAAYEPAGLLRGVGFNLRARRRLREKAGYLRFILTPTDGDLTAVNLPAKMSLVYYLLRPFRLILKREAGH